MERMECALTPVLRPWVMTTKYLKPAVLSSHGIGPRSSRPPMPRFCPYLGGSTQFQEARMGNLFALALVI